MSLSVLIEWIICPRVSAYAGVSTVSLLLMLISRKCL